MRIGNSIEVIITVLNNEVGIAEEVYIKNYRGQRVEWVRGCYKITLVEFFAKHIQQGFGFLLLECLEHYIKEGVIAGRSEWTYKYVSPTDDPEKKVANPVLISPVLNLETNEDEYWRRL